MTCYIDVFFTCVYGIKVYGPFFVLRYVFIRDCKSWKVYVKQVPFLDKENIMFVHLFSNYIEKKSRKYIYYVNFTILIKGMIKLVISYHLTLQKVMIQVKPWNQERMCKIILIKTF